PTPTATFHAITVQNPALEDLRDHPAATFSADVVIVDPKKGRVTIEALTSTDADQKATKPPMDLNNFDLGVLLDASIASIDMRALMHAYDSGLDHIDAFLIGAFKSPPNFVILGKALGPNGDLPLLNRAQPYATRSVFVVATELNPQKDPSKESTGVLSHECG